MSNSRFEFLKDEYPPLMKVSEAREFLRCGQRQVYDFIHENPQLKIRTNTRTIRVVRDELIEWLENGGYAEAQAKQSNQQKTVSS